MTWIELGKKMAEMFTDNHLVFCELLVTGNAMRMILYLVYGNLVVNKKLVPLEKLSQDQKTVIWETAKEFSKDRLDQPKLVELAKAIYCLEYLI